MDNLETIEAAYKRGANWVMENIMFLDSPDIAILLNKASYDYADKIVGDPENTPKAFECPK